MPNTSIKVSLFKVIVQTHRHTHTCWTNRSIWTTKQVDNYRCYYRLSIIQLMYLLLLINITTTVAATAIATATTTTTTTTTITTRQIP